MKNFKGNETKMSLEESQTMGIKLRIFSRGVKLQIISRGVKLRRISGNHKKIQNYKKNPNNAKINIH